MDLRAVGGSDSISRMDRFLQLDGEASAEDVVVGCGGGSLRLREKSFADFAYMGQNLQLASAGTVGICHGGDEPYVILCAMLKGRANKRIGGDDIWEEGDVNISVVPAQYATTWVFDSPGPVRQDAIVMPLPFIRRMASRYPEVFGHLIGPLERGDMFKVSEQNWRLDKATAQMLADVASSHLMGNASRDYAQTRILDTLSSRLYRMAGIEEGLSLSMRERMHEARRIVESRLACPPTLHDLALEVGTNECTLKRAFKEDFGLTVFGFLFSRRICWQTPRRPWPMWPPAWAMTT